MAVEMKRSFCRICHAACPIDVEFIDGKATKIFGVEEDPLLKGIPVSKAANCRNKSTVQAAYGIH